MNTPINILMTGAGAPGAAGILKCLAREKMFTVHTADADPEAIGQHFSNSFQCIPPGDGPAFIPVLLEHCEEKKIQLLMPLVTRELLPLASHASGFVRIGTKILVSPVESLAIANDKGKLYQFLEWRGVAVPQYRIAENFEQLVQACQELGHPEKDVTVKPTVSNGSRGFRVLSSKMNRAEMFFGQKPNSVFTSLKDLRDILENEKLPEMLVSEYLPGDEYSVDCLCKHGEAVLVVPRKRVKTVNGITVKGVFVEEHSIIAYCRSIIHELKLHGNIGIQVKASAAGSFLLLEINPRVQGTIASNLGAGINLPVLAARQELNLPLSPDELQVKWGVKFARYWDEIFY